MPRLNTRWRRILATTVAIPILSPLFFNLAFQLWYEAARPRKGPVVGISVDSAWHARSGFTTTSYKVAVTRAGLPRR